VLRIGEWRTDTYFKTQLFFDLVLNVMDRNGGPLAERRVNGHEEELRVAPSEAFRQKIEELINHPDVIHALSEN